MGCYGLGCFCFHDLGRVNKMVKKNKAGWVLLVKGLLIIFRWLGYGYSKQRVGLRVTFVQVGGVRDGGSLAIWKWCCTSLVEERLGCSNGSLP